MCFVGIGDPPTDAEMLRHFEQRVQAFSNLAAHIQSTGIEGPLDPDDKTADPAALAAQSLMREAGIRLVRRWATSQEIDFVYASSWYAGSGWAKLFVYKPAGPETPARWVTLPDLDQAYQERTLKHGFVAERPLRDGWVIRLDYQP